MEAFMESLIQEISEIEDANELRLRIIALTRENRELQNRLEECRRYETEMAIQFRQSQDEVKGLKSENAELQKQLAHIGDQNALKQNRIFGRQTEKLSDLATPGKNADISEDPLSEDADPERRKPDSAACRSGKKCRHGVRKKGKRALDNANLPRRLVFQYNPEELDRIYGKNNWRVVSWHRTEKKEYIPALYYMKCICTPVLSVGPDRDMVSIAPDDILLPGSDATSSLVASVMHDKFTLGLPGYRQESELLRRGVSLSRQTINNWILRFSLERFTQIYGHLADLVKKSDCSQSDETTFLVIRDGRKAGRKSFMWVHITSELSDEHPITVFCYEPDRSTEHLRKFYGDDYVGQIICDAYSAYQTYANEHDGTVIICGCWMHARRRWAEALRLRDVVGLTREEIDALPEARALRLIGEIYKEEMPLKSLDAKERLRRRKENVRTKVDDYYRFLDSFDTDSPEISEKMKNAIQYSRNQKRQLCRFLGNGKVPIDNGACERKIRSFGIGRNNWMFCTSPKGAEASAIMYSLVETAKSNGADVYLYLKYLLENAPISPEVMVSKKTLEELMPWSEIYRKYEAEQKEELLNASLPPSQKEPTGKTLMVNVA